MRREVWKTRLLIVTCAVVVLQALFMTGIAQAVVNATGVAQRSPTCSYAGLAGAWGYTVDGTLLPPTGAVPFAVVGRSVFNANGTHSGTQTGSLNGAVSEEKTQGTWTVNTDCTGTFTVDILDQSGSVSRTATWAVVYDNNQTELRAIIKSLVKGSISVPAVVTMSGTKQFPGAENQQ